MVASAHNRLLNSGIRNCKLVSTVWKEMNTPKNSASVFLSHFEFDYPTL